LNINPDIVIKIIIKCSYLGSLMKNLLLHLIGIIITGIMVVSCGGGGGGGSCGMRCRP